jgi:hypothetical protein
LAPKKLSTGKPTYPHFIHRVIHRQKSLKILIKNNKKKLSTESRLANNNNLLNIYKNVFVVGRRKNQVLPREIIFNDPWL